jgi:hypothetical protein
MEFFAFPWRRHMAIARWLKHQKMPCNWSNNLPVFSPECTQQPRNNNKLTMYRLTLHVMTVNHLQSICAEACNWR